VFHQDFYLSVFFYTIMSTCFGKYRANNNSCMCWRE